MVLFALQSIKIYEKRKNNSAILIDFAFVKKGCAKKWMHRVSTAISLVICWKSNPRLSASYFNFPFDAVSSAVHLLYEVWKIFNSELTEFRVGTKTSSWHDFAEIIANKNDA